ncbi:MAG: response regulator [Deltaproteobacteria bacterium]|nr:response regulator [Deltaproteobacteria bacterium]
MAVKKILVVEDNATNRKLFTTILQIEHYEVFEAEDAVRGLELARQYRPDLILMDIQLPGMDGLTATRKLKEDLGLKDIPVLALTAFAMAGDHQKAIDAGCNGYISKPIKVESFLEQIVPFLQ